MSQVTKFSHDISNQQYDFTPRLSRFDNSLDADQIRSKEMQTQKLGLQDASLFGRVENFNADVAPISSGDIAQSGTFYLFGQGLIPVSSVSFQKHDRLRDLLKNGPLRPVKRPLQGHQKQQASQVSEMLKAAYGERIAKKFEHVYGLNHPGLISFYKNEVDISKLSPSQIALMTSAHDAYPYTNKKTGLPEEAGETNVTFDLDCIAFTKLVASARDSMPLEHTFKDLFLDPNLRRETQRNVTKIRKHHSGISNLFQGAELVLSAFVNRGYVPTAPLPQRFQGGNLAGQLRTGDIVLMKTQTAYAHRKERPPFHMFMVVKDGAQNLSPLIFQIDGYAPDKKGALAPMSNVLKPADSYVILRER